MMLIKHTTYKEDYSKDTLFRQVSGIRGQSRQVLTANADAFMCNRNHITVLHELWEWRAQMHEFLRVIAESLHDIYPDFLRSAYYGD